VTNLVCNRNTAQLLNQLTRSPSIMGIRVSAVFLMIILVAGFTSFPSSLSNYSTEIVDQPHSLNLINTAFADPDNGKGNDKEKGKPDDVGKDKEKQAKNNEDYEDNETHDDEEHEFEGIITAIDNGVSFDLLLEDCTTVTIFTDDTSGLMLDFEVEVEVVLSNSSLVAKEIEIEEEEDEDHIQEFNGATVVHMSSTTTICHKPGTPAEKTKELPESALKGHLGHGDVLGDCSDITSQSLENILSKKEMKQLKKLHFLACEQDHV